MLGIIIFTPPKNIEIGTATRFTLLVPISNTASVAEIPIDAEPAARPVIPIAIAIATVDNGEIIIKLKTIEISIHINTGCNSVKLLTNASCNHMYIWQYKYTNCSGQTTYDSWIHNQCHATNTFSINKINNTAIVAVIIVLIKSPMPAIGTVLKLCSPLPT